MKRYHVNLNIPVYGCCGGLGFTVAEHSCNSKHGMAVTRGCDLSPAVGETLVTHLDVHAPRSKEAEGVDYNRNALIVNQ